MAMGLIDNDIQAEVLKCKSPAEGFWLPEFHKDHCFQLEVLDQGFF